MVDMPWPEIKKAAEEGAFVLLPIAVIEEHGPHLGLGADVYLTYLWSKLTRQALETKGIKALIAPPYYWGMNQSTGSFPGSFTVRESTLKAVLYDLHDSLRGWGFQYVLSLNLHGDPTHNRVLRYAVQEAREGLGIGAYIVPPPFPPLPASLPEQDVHAGAWETACIETYFPEDLDREQAKSLEPSRGFEPLGYFGDPARFETFAPEDVKKWYEALSAKTADWIMVIVERHRSE
jgi:creatinine amidohydrolase